MQNRRRPFEATLSDGAFQVRSARTTPEETVALLEKATREHHRVLCALASHLTAEGWTEIEEIPAAIDLLARNPVNGERVIFEVKTVTGDNEVTQTRCALSQLLEYRHYWGDNSDGLCLVTDWPISDRRASFLQICSIGIWYVGDNGRFVRVQ